MLHTQSLVALIFTVLSLSGYAQPAVTSGPPALVPSSSSTSEPTFTTISPTQLNSTTFSPSIVPTTLTLAPQPTTLTTDVATPSTTRTAAPTSPSVATTGSNSTDFQTTAAPNVTDSCLSYGNCNSCTGAPICGWCGSSCHTGTGSGPLTSTNCPSNSTWAWISSQCTSGPTGAPTPSTTAFPTSTVAPATTTTPNTTATPNVTAPTTSPNTTSPPTTPHPTTTPTTPASSGLILQSYEFSFSFFEVTFTSTPFHVSSSPQHADALVPALAEMKGIRFHLVSGPTTTVRYSLCNVAHSTCTIRNRLACTNNVNNTVVDGGDGSVETDMSVGVCGSRLFIPLQQTNVMLRVQADHQLFAFSAYAQMVN